MMLEGKVGMITGAGAGIGVEIPNGSWPRGEDLHHRAQAEPKLDETIAKLPAWNRDHVQGRRFQTRGRQRYGGSDRGVRRQDRLSWSTTRNPTGGSVVDLDPDVWHAVIETNLTVRSNHEVRHPPQIENGGGSSSISLPWRACVASRPWPRTAPRRPGLNHLTNQVALDFGKHKIRANSVLPGPVRTEMSEHSLGGMANGSGLRHGRGVQ